MKRSTTICALLFFLLQTGFQGVAHGQGKLGQIRDAVRQEAPKEDGRKRKPKQTNRDRDRNNGFGRVLSLSNFLRPTVRQVHAVHYSPPSNTEGTSAARVSETTDASQTDVLTDVNADYFTMYAPREPWCARVSIQGGTDFDDLTQGSLGLTLHFPGSRGLDSNVSVFHESGTGSSDTLLLGDVNLARYLLLGDHFRLLFGYGVNWLSDSLGSETGINFTTGFDWHLAPRWWMTGELDLGSIGDAGLTHLQIGIGRALGRSTVWATDYSSYDIGGISIKTIFSGLQFRF